ncbi:MAG: AMP-dependent synthetase [Proteobacteria bacterium]|nr:AMP-dependent synthetase [Pseudomonadota bacterium]
MGDYFDKLETRTAEERLEETIGILRKTIDLAQRNTTYFAKKLQDISAHEIKDLNDLSKLPITRKTDLIEQQKNRPPFGGMNAVEPGKLARIFSSPGPIYDPQGTTEDFWRFGRAMWAAGFRPGDIVHNTFSYHFTPAGFMVDEGAKKIGCAVFPAGIGQTEMQVRTIADLKPSAYAGTPSFLKIILEKAEELDIQLAPSISKALVGGEALLAEFRALFQERGIETRQCYGTADLGLVAYETEPTEGLVIDEHVVVEIVRPGTGQPVMSGDVGEVVVTLLNSSYPLIRYATGDLSAIADGNSKCGRTNARIKGWMGRADQTTKVRGMFVSPKQIADIQARHSYIKKARLTVEHDANKTDIMTLFCQVTNGSLVNKEQITTSLREITKMRGNVVFLKDNESLPNDGKIIEDKRKFD